MSHFDYPASSNRLSVPLPELVPFIEQVSKIARFLTATSEVGTAAVFPDLTASIREGACLIKEYRDKHVLALSELNKERSEWGTSIALREAEIGALNERKDQADLEIQTRAKELDTKRADLIRLQSDLENSKKLLQDVKSQLESVKTDQTSTERQRNHHQLEIKNLYLEEAKLKATRNTEELRLQKWATEIESQRKSVFTREEALKVQETNIKVRENAVLTKEVDLVNREFQSNMARIEAEKDDQHRDQVKSEVEALSTQKGMLQASVNELEEQEKRIRANTTMQSRKQAEEKSRLDEKRDTIEQLMERWNAQNEDLKRRQIEAEEAKQVSDAMQHDLEGFREKLKMQQIMIYADQKALERDQKSIERERQTVVTYAKGLEEMVLKEDPAYVPPEIEDDMIRTDTIFSALVEKFDDVTAQLREEVRERDRIRLQNTDLLEELGQLKRARGETQVEFETLEGENQSLRDQREADVTSLKELESTLRLAEDRHRNLIELGGKARQRNEYLKKDLKDAQLEREELQKELTDIKEQKLQLDGQYNELLCENDTVMKSYRQKGEQLKTEQTQCAKLQQQVDDNLRAQRSANDLAANLQSRYDQICKEVDARKASEIKHQKALDEERTAHAGTKGAYSELDKRIGAADEETRSAWQELNQLTVQHSSSQFRVEELQNKVKELTEWKEKRTESLSSLTVARADKDRLQTENRTLQEERKTLTTELEAKQKRIEALETQADNQQILSDAASRRQAAQERTVDDLQNTITRLRRPRDSERLAQREQKLVHTRGELATSMFDLITSRQDDNAEQRRPAGHRPIPSETSLDTGHLSRQPSPRLPQAKRPRLGPKEVARRSTEFGNVEQLLGPVVRHRDEEARRTGTFPDAAKLADCVTAHLAPIRNGTDNTALPAEVKERLLDQLKYWDGRTPNWASRLQSNKAEIMCCEHVVQRKGCQWHSDEDGLPDYYRACPNCAKNKKVCVIVTGVNKILFLPLSDEDRETYYPGRTSFEKEDVAYWLRSMDK